MKKVKLEDCELITPTEMYKLCESPEFIGQTVVDQEGMFWMVWKIEDKYYKTHNKL